MMRKTPYETVGETLYTGQLENGLSVYEIPKPGFEKKYAFFAANYGGADRRFQLDGKWRDTPAGIAHFLEHKLFDTKEGNALAALAAGGASPNAFTSAEMTAYYFECAEGFEEHVKTLLDFVSTPYFTEKSVAKEQGIIGQEIKMVEDHAAYMVYYNLLRALYAAHPVRDMIVGTTESIAEIKAQTLYELHRVFYRPSNMVLCAAGDFDPERLMEIARDRLPAKREEVPVKDYGPEDTAPFTNARTEVAMAVSQPLFLAGTRVAAGLTGEAYLRLDLIGSLALGYLAGKASPLYMRLYSGGLITGDFSCTFQNGRSHAFSSFGGESREPLRVLDAMREEVRKTLDRGLEEARFNRLKKALSGKIIQSLDSVENLCNQQTAYHFCGAKAFDRFSVLSAVSADDILDFIKRNLQPEQFALSVVRPS